MTAATPDSTQGRVFLVTSQNQQFEPREETDCQTAQNFATTDNALRSLILHPGTRII